MNTLPNDFAPVIVVTFVVSGIAGLVINIALAMLIHADAHRIETSCIPPVIAPWIWTLATLFGGIFVVGLYWVMYHSTLRKSHGP